MKIRLKQFSKSTLSVVLTLCLLFSCATVGLVATDAAQVDGESVGSYSNYSIEYNSAGSGTVSFNNSGVADVVPTSSGNMYFHFTRDDWGDHGYFGHDDETVNPNGSTEYELYQYNTNWPHIAVTAGATYHFQLTQEGGTTKYKVTETLPSKTIYFLNNKSWNNVYILLFSSAQWDDSLGVQAVNNAQNGTMTKVGSTNVYKFTTTTVFTHVAFVKDNQPTNNNLWRTEAAYASDYSDDKPLYIPGSAYKTVNETKYYNTDGNGDNINGGYWSAYTEGGNPYANMSLYIAGRFHISDGNGGWINSFDDNNALWSDTGDENILFTHYSGSIYKVATGVDLHTLSDVFTDNNTNTSYTPYFYIYDKSYDKYWYSTSSQSLTSTNQTVTLSKYNSKTNGVNDKLRFNDDLVLGPVTIVFDVATGELSYETPPYYTITGYSGAGGTVDSNGITIGGVKKQGKGRLLPLP